MNSASPTRLQAIRYTRGKLELLNQLLLPHNYLFENTNSAEDAWKAIREMKVRGAPAIAITAALGLAVELAAAQERFKTPAEALGFIMDKLEYLKTSRPTAVNLFEAADRLKEQMREAARNLPVSQDGALRLVESYIKAAEDMLEKDVSDNKALANFGADFILQSNKPPLRVLTHCNTGTLATAGYGTALGVIRALHERGALGHAFATETRPYNQGARLTAFELVYEKIPATLIADSMASFLMKTREIHAVVVGADRVVENGDTANKIGTYQLAIAAAHHGIPFFVAAPTTSIDLELARGEDIVIEERAAEELTHVGGSRIAAEGIGVWNPGFDVTPASLITAIFTEKGVVTKKPGEQSFRLGTQLR